MIIVIVWRKNRNIFYSKLYIFVNPNYVKVYFLMLSQCTRASYSETSCTDPILGNAFDAKRKKKRMAIFESKWYVSTFVFWTSLLARKIYTWINERGLIVWLVSLCFMYSGEWSWSLCWQETGFPRKFTIFKHLPISFLDFSIFPTQFSCHFNLKSLLFV